MSPELAHFAKAVAHREGVAVSIDLDSRARTIVLDAVRSVLPAATKIWVYGSRARGRAARYSDLDLASDAGRPLTLAERAELADLLTESDLPFTVDIVDLRSASDEFRHAIDADRLALG
jgi:predicted nucleotidyltransferase